MSALRDEVLNDPLTRGYDGMTSVEVVASLKTENRSVDKTSMTGSEILNNVDATQWAGLDAAGKQTVWDIVHLGTINPFGVEATLLIGVFGAGTATITALAAARVNTVSRATELGLGGFRVGDVDRIRGI